MEIKWATHTHSRHTATFVNLNENEWNAMKCIECVSIFVQPHQVRGQAHLTPQKWVGIGISVSDSTSIRSVIVEPRSDHVKCKIIWLIKLKLLNLCEEKTYVYEVCVWRASDFHTKFSSADEATTLAQFALMIY